MADRTYIPDIVEIGTAASLIKANVFTDGQRIGTDPNGYPVWCKLGRVVVDMRPNRTSEVPEDTAIQRVQPVLIGMRKPRTISRSK
jgi:hypothetical protein